MMSSRGPSVERLKHAAALRAGGDSWLTSFVTLAVLAQGLASSLLSPEDQILIKGKTSHTK
jgi:hypothetical protein